MTTEIYRPVQSAGAEALRARLTTRHHGRALVLTGRGEPVSAQLIGALSAQSIEPLVVRLSGAELPDPSLAELIVLAGAEPYASARTASERERELDWLRAADAAGTPVLGLGHGARALADALGGEVVPAAGPYLGWAFVDTIAPHQIAAGPWLAWQHDVIHVPNGAEVIAHNRYGVQAFRIGRHLGVQFHPDATPAALERWATIGSDGAERYVPRTQRDPVAAARCAEQLFRTWLTAL